MEDIKNSKGRSGSAEQNDGNSFTIKTSKIKTQELRDDRA